MTFSRVFILAVTFSLAACASTTSQDTQQNAAALSNEAKPQIVKSRDGSFSGEVIGTAEPGSKFSSLQIGMQIHEVQAVLNSAPDRSHTYETGKRWIPFYFGNDARRMQALYNGEGCLIFADGNAWGGAGGDLIQIQHDPSGACYQP